MPYLINYIYYKILTEPKHNLMVTLFGEILLIQVCISCLQGWFYKYETCQTTVEKET